MFPYSLVPLIPLSPHPCITLPPYPLIPLSPYPRIPLSPHPAQVWSEALTPALVSLSSQPLIPLSPLSVVQVGQLTMAPDSEGKIKLQYADGSTSDHVKVDLVAKAS